MPVSTGNTLSKEERLYCRKDISDLLAGGRFIWSGPVRCCYLPGNGKGFNRIMVSVPKKMFKRAVKRNLLKRRIRESYRLHKKPIAGGTDMLFIYTSKEVADSVTLSTHIAGILDTISARTNE